MLERIGSWFRNLWQKYVQEPLEARKARAAIKREQTIVEAPRAVERGREKLIAYDVAKKRGAGVAKEQLASETAKRIRSLKTSGQLPAEAERVAQTLPQPVKRATRPLWETAASATRTLGSKTWNAILWTLRQLNRPAYAAKSFLHELRQGQKELQAKYPLERGRLSPQLAKEKPELARQASKDYIDVVKRAYQAAVRGFLRPEEVEQKDLRFWSKEDMPKNWPGWLKETLSIGTDIAVESLLDPTQAISIVRKTKVADDLLPWLRKISDPRARALAADDFLRRSEAGVTRLKEAARRLRQQAKTLYHGDVKLLKQQANTAQRFLNRADSAIQRAITKRDEAVQRLVGIVQRMEEARSNAQDRIQRLMSTRETLEELIATVTSRPKYDKRKVASWMRQLDRIDDEIAKVRQQFGKTIAKLEAQRQKAAGRLAQVADEIIALRNRQKASQEVIDQFNKAMQRVQRMQTVADSADEAAKRVADIVKNLRASSEYTLQIGRLSIPLSSIGEQVGHAFRTAISRTPGVREVTNLLARAFRPGTVLYSPDVAANVASDVGKAKQITLDWLRRASTEGSATAWRSLERLQKLGIPDEAWRAATTVESVLQGREIAEEALKKLPEEIRPHVQRVMEVWTASLDDVQRRLEEVFGPEMAGYFGKTLEDVGEGWRFFLEGYLPHIVTDPPERIREAIPKVTQLLAKKAPGSRPSFTRERLVDTIEALKEAGLKPVEDIRILEAAHRAQAERLLQLKHMTDWLEAQGYIKPLEQVDASWKKAGKLFPWLKGYAIHPEIADAVEQVQKVFAYDNAVVRTLAKASQAVMNVFRPLVTTFRPKFHLNNILGNVALAMQAGMKPQDIPEYLAKGLRILVSPKTDEERRLIDLFQRYGLEGQGIFRNAIEAPKQFVKELENYLEKIGSPIGKIKAVFWPRHGSRIPGLEFMSHLGQATDNAFRMGAFLHFIDKGYTPTEAAQLVKRYFFDYGALSAFERNVMRHVFPFYAWMRYAIPRAILGPIEHPYFATTFARTIHEFAEKEDVDVSKLPPWMQTAIILDVDEEGKIIYLPTQPPHQTLIQFLGAYERGGLPGLQREIASNLSPLLTAGIQIATGVSPTGEPTPETGIDLLKSVVKKFVPVWEIEGVLRAPYDEDRPRTTYPFADSLAALVSPVSVYDQPYAQAREQVRAEQALDEVISELRKSGVEVPETQAIESEIRKLDRAAMAQAIMQELPNNTWKRSLIEVLSAGSEKRAWDLVNEHPELFYGSNKEVAARIKKVLTPENLLRLRVYLGRPIKPYDIVAYYTKLERGELEPIPPEARAMQRIVEQIRKMREAQQSGGAPQTTSRSIGRINRPLTNDELNTILREAMRITGISEDWLPYLRWLVRAENAKLDPMATNPIPVNGEHATGLMQTLPSTFRAYAAPGMDDIYNPLHNMVAAIRYIKARYGHPSRIPGIGRKPWKGY